MLILDLWGISFHPVVVVGLGNDLLFNFIVAHCVRVHNINGKPTVPPLRSSLDQEWQQFLKLQEFWLQLLVIELVKLKNETAILKIFPTPLKTNF